MSDNPTAKTVSVKQGLEANWSESHGIIRHEREPAIEFTAEQEQILNKPRLCLHAGCCICGKGNKEGLEAEFFLRKLRAYMKRIFWSSPKQRSKATERVMLEKGEIVLCLRGKPCVTEEEYEQAGDYKCVREAVFFHLGYTNFTSWRMVWHELRLFEETGLPADEDRILLQACSMTEFLESIPTLQDDGIRVDAAAVMACLDLNLEYTVTFFAIDSNDKVVPNHEMKCGLVQVSKLSSLQPFRLWLGLKQERENRSSSSGGQGKRKEQDSGEAGNYKQAKLRNFFAPRRRAADHAAVENSDTADAQMHSDKDAEEALDAALAQLMAQNDDSAAVDSEPPLAFDFMAELGDLLGEDPELEAALLLSQQEAEDEDGQADVLPDEDVLLEGGGDDGNASADDAEEVEAAAAEGLPPVERDFAGRRPGVSELVLAVGGDGFLRYNITGNYMRAQCPMHDDCFRRRVLYAGRLGQGRPIGSLVAWLKDAGSHSNKSSHVKAPLAPLAARIAARTYFATLPDAQTFLAKERNMTDAERRANQREPVSIP